jgi:hypothetical protein
MNKLRAHVDGEVMPIEFDVERLDVPANVVATLEEHDILLPALDDQINTFFERPRSAMESRPVQST